MRRKQHYLLGGYVQDGKELRGVLLIVLVIVLCGSVLVLGCGSRPTIVGKWVQAGREQQEYRKFESDGTFTSELTLDTAHLKSRGEYTFDGKVLYMHTIEEIDELTGIRYTDQGLDFKVNAKLHDNLLSMDDSVTGYYLEWKRVKE